mgnify:CR=1 FL=1
MKNKFYISSVLKIFFIFLINFTQLSADDILIDAKEVDIKEKGNLIKATGDVNITDHDNILISGNEAIYNKLTQLVEIKGNVNFIDESRNYKGTSNKVVFDREKNIISTFNNTLINLLDEKNENIIFKLTGNYSIFDQNNKNLKIKENVILDDLLNNYKIYSNNIIYSNSKEIIKSLGDTKIDYNNEFNINTKDILFNIKNKNFYSDKKTFITDKFGNKFELSSFDFDLEKKILKSKNIEFIDEQNNSLKLINAYIDLKSNEIIGSDFNLKFHKNLFNNSENDPRLTGRYILTNKKETIMKKSSFTTCKDIDGKCPAWSISADQVKHKKEKKRIEYKNAWLEIYDTPVAYFPYFFHPDPTVKRQSGFLFPEFVNTKNLGFSNQIPYFLVIDDDKDMTISPRLYTNNNLFLQTEYRQEFKNSSLVSDFSYNKKDSSNSHFFATLFSNFEDSFYEMKIETVSNKDYLKQYQIKSPLIKNYSTLNSSFIVEIDDENSSFSSSIDIFEDLTKPDSDKYEYIFPNYEFTKQTYLNNNIFQTLNYKSSGNYRKYNTNVDELDVINDLIFTSNDKFNFIKNSNSDFTVLLRNVNTYGDLSNTYKNDKSYSVLSSVLYNFNYPLFKETAESKKFLTPIASFRYSPNPGLNLKNKKTLITYDDMFNLDRVGGNTVEEGGSATIGLEYKNQNSYNYDKLNLKLAINFRTNEDKDLPLSSSLNKKTSDIIGYSGINVTENLSLNYNFSIDKDLSETNYSLVSANYDSSKFKTNFEYMEKSKFIGDESYLTNSTYLSINKSNSLGFETSRNIDQDLTDYYNLIYKYKNDCLEASIVYNKQFYQDDSVNSGQNIFFKIALIPFAEINAPNISK